MSSILTHFPVVLLLGLAAPLVGSGCATHGRVLAEVTPEINATLDVAPLRIAPGDTLMASFPDKEEWEQTVQVRLDGRASFMSIGEFQMAGLTLPEAEAKVQEAYGAVFPQLQVSLGTSTLAVRNVYVMGEVHEPGAFPIVGRLSLIEAIGLAGGPLKETALLERTMLVRWVPGENRQRIWNIDADYDLWDTGVPLMLQPYDVIFVPNTPIDDVDIWIDQYIRRLIPFPYLIPTPY